MSAYNHACDDDQERRPLLSSSASGVPNPTTPGSAVPSIEDDSTSPVGSRHCLTSYVPIEAIMLAYTLSRIIIMQMTALYFFDEASRMYGDPSMNSLNPCAGSDGHPEDKEKAENVQKEMVQLVMIGTFSDYMTAVIPAMILGPLIDRVGRRVGFVMPLLGTIARGIVFLIVLGTGASAYFLYIGTVLEGLGGGFASFFMTTYSSVADITTPGRQRALRICICEAIQVFGSSAAVVICGQWRKDGYTDSLIFASALGVVNLIYILWFLPETLRRPGASQPDSVCQNHRQQSGRTGDSFGDSVFSNDRAQGPASNTLCSSGTYAVMAGGGTSSGDGTGVGSRSVGLAGGESYREDSGTTAHSYESGGSRGDSPYPSPSLIAPTNPVIFSGGTKKGFIPASATTPTSLPNHLRGRHVGEILTLPSPGSTSINSTSAVLRSGDADASHLASVIGNIRKSWSVYFRSDDASHPDRRRVLVLCFVSFVLVVAVDFSKPSLEESFRMTMLCWNAKLETGFTASWLVEHWVCILLLLHVLQHRLHVHDVYIAMIGCVSGIAAALVFSFATLPDIPLHTASILVFAAPACGSLNRALIPMLRSMASASVNTDEQGAMFVSFACVELFGAAVFSMAASRVYNALIHVWSGIVYIIMVLFLTIDLILMVVLSLVLKRRRQSNIRTQYESFANCQ